MATAGVAIREASMSGHLHQRRLPRKTGRTSLIPIVVVAASFASIPWAGGERAWAGGRDMEGVVNLNTASVDVLALLPGIGPAKARSIAAYRLRRPFRTVDELVRIQGIGRRMVREIRPHLAVSGPSTARGTPAGSSSATRPVVPPPPPAPPPRLVCRPPLLRLTGRHESARSRARPETAPARSRANHCAPPA